MRPLNSMNVIATDTEFFCYWVPTPRIGAKSSDYCMPVSCLFLTCYSFFDKLYSPHDVSKNIRIHAGKQTNE